MLHKLYNDTVNLYFDDARHLYTVNGEKVDGVTSVLGVINKPALIFWAVNSAVDYFSRNIKAGKSYDEIELKKIASEAARAHRMRSSEAADIGKIVHQYCEDWISGKKPALPVNKEAKNACQEFVKWVKEDEVEFLESERVVYSKQYNYAGTADFICRINNKIYLGDFKTSKAIYHEYFLQTSAYQIAYTEEFPATEIFGHIIVRLSKSGDFEIKKDYEFEKNKEVFLAAHILYKRIQEINDKRLQEQKNPTVVMDRLLA